MLSLVLVLHLQTLQMLSSRTFALAVVTIATILPVGLPLWPIFGSLLFRASLHKLAFHSLFYGAGARLFS